MLKHFGSLQIHPSPVWTTLGSNRLRGFHLCRMLITEWSRWCKCSINTQTLIISGVAVQSWWLDNFSSLCSTWTQNSTGHPNSTWRILFHHRMSLVHTWFPSHIKHSSLTTHWRLAAVSWGMCFPFKPQFTWKLILGTGTWSEPVDAISDLNKQKKGQSGVKKYVGFFTSSSVGLGA